MQLPSSSKWFKTAFWATGQYTNGDIIQMKVLFNVYSVSFLSITGVKPMTWSSITKIRSHIRDLCLFMCIYLMVHDVWMCVFVPLLMFTFGECGFISNMLRFPLFLSVSFQFFLITCILYLFALTQTCIIITYCTSILTSVHLEKKNVMVCTFSKSVCANSK